MVRVPLAFGMFTNDHGTKNSALQPSSATRGGEPSQAPSQLEAVLALRQDGAVGLGVAQVELEPEPVAALAGGVQREREVVTVEKTLIAPAQVFDQRVRILGHPRPDVEALGRCRT